MKMPQRNLSYAALTLFFAMLGSILLVAQQAPAGPELRIRTVSLPKAFVNANFEYQLRVDGGTNPYHFRLDGGTLPKGLSLTEDGKLKGTPIEVGEFHFDVSVHDSSQPALEHTQSFTLTVTAPLLARWERYPKLNGQRIEGSVKVSNDTDRDFDLTFIAVAVNEINKAQTLGYQHFVLKKNTVDFEIPFGENVPFGSYKVDADVVGEVPATNSIHRVHLDSKEMLTLQQSP